MGNDPNEDGRKVTPGDRFNMTGHASRLWAAVPPHCRSRRHAVTAALCRAISEHGADPDYIIDQAVKYYDSPAGRSQYRIHLENFIAKGCYCDDPAAWQQGDVKTDHGDGITPSSGSRAKRTSPLFDAETGMMRDGP